MSKDKNNNQKESFGEVEQVLTKTEQFIESHLKTILYVIGGIVVVVLAFVGIKKFVASPRSAESQEQIFTAQNYFSKDSFDLALNGDGNSLGFLDIIDEYGSTKAGKLSKYYAGICFLHLGEYNNAIDYLKKFKTDDMLLAPLAKSAIGDAYVELNQLNKAISAYKDALSISENEFTTPTITIKLALALEADGNKDEAISVLEKIKNKYPNNTETMTIEKNIARLKQ
ncbi:MAG: tetratricopeptide repeat protein [Prolixibacteraceae bacterium]|nr:tetratricopeptide repeat protein [Prolixibacteraceae bacterium]